MGRRGIPYNPSEVDETTPETPEQTPKKEESTLAVVNCDFLNIRKAPNAKADVVLVVSAGTRLIGVSASDTWVHVKTTTGKIQEGYAVREYLKEL